MRKAYTNFIIIVVPVIVLLSVILSDASQTATNFEGKIVDTQGKPVVGVKVIAKQDEPLKGYDRVESVTKSDGIFVLTGLYPQDRYKIYVEGGQCNDVDTSITTGPEGETKLLKGTIVLKYSPFKISKDGVIVDPRTGLEWAPYKNNMIAWNVAKTYVENLSFAGGGWRLPTENEIRSLYETNKGGCGIEKDLRFHNWMNTVWTSESNGMHYLYFNLLTGETGWAVAMRMDGVLPVRSK